MVGTVRGGLGLFVSEQADRRLIPIQLSDRYVAGTVETGHARPFAEPEAAVQTLIVSNRICMVGCLLMANNGLPGHVAGTSALPPTADLRVSMSGFMAISSASPSGADLASSIAERLFLTQSGHKHATPNPHRRPL